MNKKNIHTNKEIQEYRSSLRNNSTYQERIMWNYLKHSQTGFKFQRQHSIGPYIADFYCFKKKLIIELDGEHHLSNREYDTERTRYFDALGYQVLRFWNKEIDENLEAVLMKIKSSLNMSI